MCLPFFVSPSCGLLEQVDRRAVLIFEYQRNVLRCHIVRFDCAVVLAADAGDEPYSPTNRSIIRMRPASLGNKTSQRRWALSLKYVANITPFD
jgi:hypothetical protein